MLRKCESQVNKESYREGKLRVNSLVQKQRLSASEGSPKLLLMQSIVEKTKERRICGRAL